MSRLPCEVPRIGLQARDDLRTEVFYLVVRRLFVEFDFDP